MGRVLHHRDAEPGPDVVLAALAARQWGVVTRRQLAAIGIERGAVARRVAAGRLHRLHRGVYAVGHTALRKEARWLAAVLACGDGAALSHRSAAALWGIRPTASARIEVSVPRSRDGVAGVVVHRPRRLTPDDVTEKDGIPATTPARTLHDLACLLRPAALERAQARAQRMGLVSHHEHAALTRSPLEARLLTLIRAAGLPEPEVNAWLTFGGGEEWQVDFLWRAQRVIAEADGRRDHDTGRAFEADRRRDQTALVAGFVPVRFTHRQVTTDPASVTRTLRALLGPVASRA
jgi:very-short-patch-repair endonuclease